MNKDILSIYFHIKRKLENSPKLRCSRYHGWMHTKTFFDVVCYLAALEDIGDKYTRLIKIAALYHDTGYTLGDGMNHEHISADIAQDELYRLFEFSKDDINIICRLIESTAPDRTPSDILEEIMCDADFEYIGRDYYPHVSELLRIEKGTLSSIWKAEQIAFLNRHRFITRSAQKLFNHQKDINIRKLKVDY